MKLTRITDIVHVNLGLEDGIFFTLDGKPRNVRSEFKRTILKAGWVRMYGLSDEEEKAPLRKVTLTIESEQIPTQFEAGWTNDPQVLYLVRRWITDTEINGLVPYGPYDPGEDDPILD